MAWGLEPRERIRTSQWPGDWTLERIRTSLDFDSVREDKELSMAWGLGPHNRLNILVA